MQIGIHHAINDPQKWQQPVQSIKTKAESGTLPPGLRPLLAIPATNRKIMFCVWDADSIDTVKKFIDRETGPAARNEYFEVDTKNAIGLPEAAHAGH